MKVHEIIDRYKSTPQVKFITEALLEKEHARFYLRGLVGSARVMVLGGVFRNLQRSHLVLLPDKELAAYFYNDLEAIFEESGMPMEKKNILFFPSSFKRQGEFERPDRSQVLGRTEVLNRLITAERKTVIVTYPEALAEKVARKKVLTKNTLRLKVGEKVSPDFIADVLLEYQFERVDFVYEPGQFSIRGGIVDVFSFANEKPYRIEFFGEEVESLRTFDITSQLSIEKLDRVTILPSLSDRAEVEARESFLAFMPGTVLVWADDIERSIELARIQKEKSTGFITKEEDGEYSHMSGYEFLNPDELARDLLDHSIIEFGLQPYLKERREILFNTLPQPSFNKNFDLLIQNLEENTRQGVENFILSDNPRQIERIYSIFEDLRSGDTTLPDFRFTTLNLALHEGFIDKETGWALYTDHQIFERYHRFHLKDAHAGKEAITLKELYNLTPGDYVTHIDHGIGRFDGLETLDINGKQQEAIRIIYKNSDLLYVSIHSLHRIAKYIGKDGAEPTLNRLGSNAWNRLKSKTKSRVKDIAKELIQLYAQRKGSEGFAFSPDTYLQNELEASFIYEDTPDQLKSTNDVKADMEKGYPMDRLVCGDVGFGKTEVAMRGAFKAVADNKQVAVLVPTTILALQHYKTFRERLAEFPCSVDYINRFKSTKKQKETLKALSEGKLDILIGTHRLLGKDIKFKDLGLLIIDEEQKFGVGAKEKLKRLKVNVDTLTLTATPIPRTLQFSLMGARDLSVINTAPPNRYPIQTEIRAFGKEVIHDAVMYEVSRGGQAFFVHNRVQNILDVEKMIHKFCPGVSVAVAHGQMEGARLEKIMLEFIDGMYDVLLATTIIESGLDIPNVNTIIINDAHHFGLSDLHQLRGRVGRSNKKAFCYLLAPPVAVLTNEARKRLKAIEEFSDLGSGFNIAMRDLDIRGAGNILGAEQSGFISDIGFEMYHKILDEAIEELKETEFKELFKEEKARDFVRECQIETDLEILIPGDYISNSAERLIIYKDLDSMEKEEELASYREKLIDRFGPVPRQADELFNTIRLRWLARRAGFEKIIMKNNRLICHFITNQESLYFKSDIFMKVLSYVKDNPSTCRMKETQNRLSLTFRNVTAVGKAIHILDRLLMADQ